MVNQYQILLILGTSEYGFGHALAFISGFVGHLMNDQDCLRI